MDIGEACNIVSNRTLLPEGDMSRAAPDTNRPDTTRTLTTLERGLEIAAVMAVVFNKGAVPHSADVTEVAAAMATQLRRVETTAVQVMT
jgi:hypothetical protein